METHSYMAAGDTSEPVQALVLHRAGSRHLALSHTISEGPAGGPILDAGELMTDAQLRAFSAKLQGQAQERELIPEAVRLTDPDVIVWQRPACRRLVWFATRDKQLNRELNGNEALHPALLFVGRARRLAVYALPNNNRVTMQTPLWRAPYFNLWLSGEMCEGDVYLPPDPAPTEACLASYERAFYDSSFVHTNVKDGPLTTYPGGHDALWRMLTQPGHGVFPAMFLVPAIVAGQRLTLERVLGQ